MMLCKSGAYNKIILWLTCWSESSLVSDHVTCHVADHVTCHVADHVTCHCYQNDYPWSV